jgi:hypothetical protein
MLWIADGLVGRAGGHTQIGQIWVLPWSGHATDLALFTGVVGGGCLACERQVPADPS